MQVETFNIEGILLLKPRVFYDERGYFFESWNAEIFHKAGIHATFVQDNQSKSSKNVLRGLHFQKPPYEQGKLVRVVQGRVLDIAVDIRKNSPTYGKSVAVELNSTDHVMLWIPPGFAHGFLSLEDDTLFLYKCTSVYHKESEQGIIWNDPDLALDWGTAHPTVSAKDLELPVLKNMESPF